jgi:hypothetical protein
MVQEVGTGIELLSARTSHSAQDSRSDDYPIGVYLDIWLSDRPRVRTEAWQSSVPMSCHAERREAARLGGHCVPDDEMLRPRAQKDTSAARRSRRSPGNARRAEHPGAV